MTSRILLLLPGLVLTGCADVALQERVAELEASQTRLVAENTTITARLDTLEARASAGLVRPAPRPAPEPITGVLKISDDQFKVESAVLQAWLSDRPEISLRALPHRGIDGTYDGFRLSAIRRSSMASALGIKNGDIVHAVNGHPVTDSASAMVAYGAVTDADSIIADITRRGKKLTLTIDVVDALPVQP